MDSKDYSSWLGGLITLIIGIVSFYGARMGSRETVSSSNRKNRFDGECKISQYRLEWIQSLRGDLIRFDAIITNAYFSGTPISSAVINNLSNVLASITLKMNRNDAHYQALIETMEHLITCPTITAADYAKRAEFVRLSQLICKTEWDEAKKGIREGGQEPTVVVGGYTFPKR